MRKTLLTFLALAALPAPVPAAQNYESHQAIRDAALAHARKLAAQFPGKIKVSTSPLDRRLRLPACDRPLQAYNSPNGLRPGRGVVGVRCEGSHPWKLYVGVQIATLQPVVVLARPVARNQLLQAADLKTEWRDTSRLHRAYYTRDDLPALRGMKARRALPAGQVLNPTLLGLRQLVWRGARVEILARHGALQVRMAGKALQNGSRGQRIRVRNLSSGREISGEVIASGVIQVSP